MIASKGYDLNYVIDHNALGLVHAATLIDRASGSSMTVETTEPGLQRYTGNLLDSKVEGPIVAPYQQSDSVCLKTNHYPNSPNTPQFPSTVCVRPNLFHPHNVKVRLRELTRFSHASYLDS